MADAKIVDIKGVQWELKDEVARNSILNLQNKDEEISARIDNVEKTTFSNVSGRNFNITPNAEWVKVSGLYSGDFYNCNIFIITARRGQVIQLICPIDDANEKITPIVISLWSGIGKLADMKFKGGNLYIKQAGWNALKINQISGDKVKVEITDENPPGDAIDIAVYYLQLKQ